MARRRKRTHSRRRHRVGALSLGKNSMLMTLGSVAVGYLGGTQINSMINMLIPASMKTGANTGKAVAAAQVGAGALLLLGKGKKSLIKSVAGGLLAGAGLKRAMVVFAPNTTDTLGGYGDMPVIGAYAVPGQVGRRTVRGYGDVPVVGYVPGTSHGMGAYVPNSSLTGSQKVMGSVDGGSGSGVGCDYLN